jgi:hypothetical protein
MPWRGASAAQKKVARTLNYMPTYPMKYRKLRIAWSVAWGTVAVLLCVLWMRSYWRFDLLHWPSSNNTQTTVGSNMGVVYLNRSLNRRQNDWAYKNLESHQMALSYWFIWENWNVKVDLGIPYWCLIPPPLVLTCLPWFHYRFSLRTLLISTTLVAVVLMLALLAMRN